MELIIRAKELLKGIEYINVATASKAGLPWNTPVYAKYDEYINFFWSSWKEAEHSINIRHNPEVFITLYDSTRKRGDNNRRCLFIKATAYEVDDKDIIDQAIKLLYGNDEKISTIDEYSGEAVKRIYSAKPERFWLNDKSEREVTHETIKMRVEVSYQELISHLTSS